MATVEERTKRSILVGNIPVDTTEEMLTFLLREFGTIVYYKFYNESSGNQKAYAFCEYENSEVALSAIHRLNDLNFRGQLLKVESAASDKSPEEIESFLQGGSSSSPVMDTESINLDATAEKAPEEISKAVASLPPEQMFELMKQMKMCIENNPHEARNLLLQNPQLAYALLQAQVIMHIVEPQVALKILDRPIAVPTSEAPAGGNVPLDGAIQANSLLFPGGIPLQSGLPVVDQAPGPVPPSMLPNMVANKDFPMNVDQDMRQPIREPDISNLPSSNNNQMFDPRFRAGMDPRMLQGPNARMQDPRMMSALDPRGIPGSDPRGMLGLNTGPNPDPRALSSSNPKAMPFPDPRAMPFQDPRGMPMPDPRGMPNPDPRGMPNPDPRAMLNPDPRGMLNPDPRAMLNPDPRAMLNPDPRSMPNVDPRSMPNVDPRGMAGLDPRMAPNPDPRILQNIDPRTLNSADPRAMRGPMPDPRIGPVIDPRISSAQNPKAQDPRMMAGVVDPRILQGDPRGLASIDPRARQGSDPRIKSAIVEDPRKPPVSEGASGSARLPAGAGVPNVKAEPGVTGAPPNATDFLPGMFPTSMPQDKEKAALIMQVLQLSDEQISMLPADQRQSILILKEQISRSQLS